MIDEDRKMFIERYDSVVFKGKTYKLISVPEFECEAFFPNDEYFAALAILEEDVNDWLCCDNEKEPTIYIVKWDLIDHPHDQYYIQHHEDACDWDNPISVTLEE